MANQIKTYFLSPTWDYHPSGPIQLGNIITSASRPAEALNGPDSPRPATVSLFPPMTKSHVTWSSDKLREGRYGLWTKFLSFIGLSVDFGLEHSAQLEQSFTFETLETVEFIPTTEFLQETLATSPLAVDFLTRSRFRKPLYVVTAVKIARGACVAETSRSISRGAEVGVGVDGTLVGGALVSLGPEIRAGRANGESGSFAGSSDFVFAFQLRKIVVERSTGRVTNHVDHTSGAMYDTNSGVSPSETGLPFVVRGTTSEDASGLKLGGGSGEAVVQEDDETVCVRTPAVPS
ncbi:uncharacterized protein DNG_05168 [Cephalotrichum gorgonifer]|uniref:Uncharacterized protein n=1 Tax=Cephalotrichum gorgonifer TaxID=2041049 RepID=A0AAE8MXZ1_9PEZI|nr:uncharacterized protein DNG_05168 [Cephalotrichum gorgonifer]